MSLQLNSSRQDEVLVLTVTGDLTAPDIGRFRDELARHGVRQAAVVLVDLTAMATWSVAAQAVLVAASRHASHTHRIVVLFGLGNLPVEQLAASGLRRSLTVTQTRAQALTIAAGGKATSSARPAFRAARSAAPRTFQGAGSGKSGQAFSIPTGKAIIPARWAADHPGLAGREVGRPAATKN
jgi:anti-anti-sigma regulatory factor